MTFIEMLFKLIRRFVDLDEERVKKLEIAAMRDVEKFEDTEGLAGKAIKVQQHWLCQVLMCFVGIGLARSISRWVTSPVVDEDEDDEDDDEEDEKNKALYKLVSRLAGNKRRPVEFSKL